MLTGYLHEVPEVGYAEQPELGAWPDPQLYGLGEVHDAYGNSLGMLFLPKLIGGAIGKIFGGGSPPLPPLPPLPAVTQSCPPCPPCPACGSTMPTPPFPYPYPPPGYAPRRRRRR
jgi:hypothetical protein